MGKKIVAYLCLLFSTSLTALDSGTVSATLYYHLSHDEPDTAAADLLFGQLLDVLSEESASPEIIESTLLAHREFLEGNAVESDVKDIWKRLVGLKAAEEAVGKKIAFQLIASYNDVKKNPFIDEKHYKTIKPWILPEKHPMKARLDAIFKSSRAIQDKVTFQNAGFDTFAVQPRSFIRVARHPDLPGYVVKVYLDTELRLKKSTPGWKWFARRCEGAKRIRDILKRKKIKFFKAPEKWIYPLPINPAPLTGPEYSPKAEILLAQDMGIVSYAESLVAWKTVMTKAHLDELYIIIAYGNGHSYRPDNIPYARDGKFAFVDTEYPDLPPNFTTPLKFLSDELIPYWKQLIEKGGPN
jgi:hypothetical protein